MIKSLEDVYNELKKDDVTLQTKYQYSSDKTKGKVKNLSLGRIWFNLLLPNDYKLVDQPITKKDLKKILVDIYNKYDNKVFVETVDKIKKEAFKIASIQPTSYTIEDLILPPEIEEKKKKLLSEDLDSSEFHKRAVKLAEEYLQWLKENDSGTYQIMTSGAKGSIDLIANLMIARGGTIDIENEVDPPITKSLVEGYNIKEYFQASKVARRAFYIVAEGTAMPGDLNTRITFANANTTVVDGDCGTSKYLLLDIRDGIENGLIGRYYLDEDKNDIVKITETNKSKIKGKTIKLRSPIYCKSPGDTICSICYGDLSKRLETKHVGLVAASALNRATVEGYSMKAKHSLGIVKIDDADFTKDIIEMK